MLHKTLYYLLAFVVAIFCFASNLHAQSTVKYSCIDTVTYTAKPYKTHLKPPAYPGGDKAFYKFLFSKIHLPDSIKLSDKDHPYFKEELATIQVENDGSISSVQIDPNFEKLQALPVNRDIISNDLITNELIVAIRQSKWRPAIFHHKKVPCPWFINIYFAKREN